MPYPAKVVFPGCTPEICLLKAENKISKYVTAGNENSDYYEIFRTNNCIID